MTARTLALASVAFIGLAGASSAGHREVDERILVRGNLLYRLHVPVWPAVKPSGTVAPWYMWWPADANQTLTQLDFQSSPYPTWPATPPQAGADPRPQGQMTFAPQQYPPTPFQPVSYPRSQVPSYWYGR
jgi:hypothetical protein